MPSCGLGMRMKLKTFLSIFFERRKRKDSAATSKRDSFFSRSYIISPKAVLLRIRNFEANGEDSENGNEAEDIAISPLDIQVTYVSPRLKRVESEDRNQKESQSHASGVHKTRASRRSFTSSTYKTIEFGKAGTLQQRILFRRNGWQEISPWHDIPVYDDEQDESIINFICTTPKGQWVNTEIAGDEKFNPLRVKETKDKRPSHFAQNLPYNYGYIPQTAIETDFAKKEPIRVFDISVNSNRKAGDVFTVKPIAAFLSADDEMAMSWHVVAIDTDDPKSASLNGLDGFEEKFPGVLDEIASWLASRNCVMPGDEDSELAMGGMPTNLQTVLKVIRDSHSSWRHFCKWEEASMLGKENTGPLMAEDLEVVWQEYTASKSTECIQIKEPQKQASLKYERAWEYVMAHEQVEEETELEPFEDMEQPSSWTFIKTPKVFSKRSMSLSKCETETIRTLNYQGSPVHSRVKTFAEGIYSPKRESPVSKKEVRESFFHTPPRSSLSAEIRKSRIRKRNFSLSEVFEELS